MKLSDILPKIDPRYFEHDPMCQGCGVRLSSDEHHITHKSMGGRHGQARIASEAPKNKIKLCRTCHAASHGIKHIEPDGFSCFWCPRKVQCRFGARLTNLPYEHLKNPWQLADDGKTSRKSSHPTDPD